MRSQALPMRKTGAVIIALICIALAALFIWVLQPGMDKLLIYVALAGFFPISAIVYGVARSSTMLTELKNDLDLLGIMTSQDRILERYQRAYAQWNYAAHYMLTVLLTLLGLSLFWLPAGGTVYGFNADVLQAMRYGFLGSYIFAISLVYRRYTTMDLQPYVYMNCALTIVSGLAFNYVAFEAIGKMIPASQAQIAGIGAGLAAVTSFSLGFFPYLATRWFSRVAYTALQERQRRSDQLPLAFIDGISRFHEARLRDEGIDNLQNLASARIDELLLNTRFSAQQIIEWIDQAALYLYLEQSEIESFRRGGIRNVSDFQDFWGPFRARFVLREDGTVGHEPTTLPDEFRKALAQQLQSTPERLDALYRTTAVGPNMAHIRRYWESLKL